MRLQQPVTHKLAALLLLLLSLVMAVEGARPVYLDLLASGVETELSFWGAESYHPPDASVRRIDADLQRLLQLPPVAPDYLTWRAYFRSWRGYFGGDVRQRLAVNQQAVDVRGGLYLRAAHNRQLGTIRLGCGLTRRRGRPP